jgi:hypothetical protein
MSSSGVCAKESFVEFEGERLPDIPEGTEELVVSMCPSLISMEGLPASLKSVNAFECPKLKEIELGPNTLKLNACECPALERLSGADSLRQVFLDGCPSAGLLDDVSGVEVLHVTGSERVEIDLPGSLTTLYLSRCSRIERLDLSGCERLDGLFVNDMPALGAVLALPAGVRGVYAAGCGALETVETDLCDRLETLHVAECPKLRAVRLPLSLACGLLAGRGV